MTVSCCFDGHEVVVTQAAQVEGAVWQKKAVVVVDPLSSGAVLAQMFMERNYAVVRVVSTHFPDEVLKMLPAACHNLQFAATIQHEGDADETIRQLKALDLNIIHITVGCESGVELCDALSARFGNVPTNGEESSRARRDKYLMGECIRKAGIRAAKQVETNKWEEVEAFVNELFQGRFDMMKVVLKPLRSAGTENVHFATSMAQAREAFDLILGRDNMFGETNDMVLVQEFLKGQEYVVDTVSQNGEHKVVAIYHYDKRVVNDSNFVYFGVNVYESEDGQREAMMSEYIFKVLDALDVMNGPAHSEVMWLEHDKEPCLVETGARPHGGEGTFVQIAQRCYGYNQLQIVIDAIDDLSRFKAIPTRPGKLQAHARELTLVSREEGKLNAYPMLDQVKDLPSFHSLEIKVHPGEDLQKTTDFLTTPGSVMLVHKSAKLVENDYNKIHGWEEQGLFYECY